MNWWIRARLGILTLVSACAVLLQEPVRAQPKKSPTLDEIEKAWKERQGKVQGLYIKWKENRHFPRGYYSSQQRLREPEFAERFIPKEAVLPSRDTEVEFVSALTFDGRRVRYHTADAMFNLAKAAYVVTPKIYVYDGEKDLALARENEEWKPLGIIHKPMAYFLPRGPHLGPILCHIRPCDFTWCGIDLKRHTVTQRSLRIDGVWCIELEMGSASQSQLYRYYLDPQKGFVLMRCVTVSKGKVISQQDIRYSPDPVLGWMPTSWVTVGNHVDGKTLNTERGKVLTYSLNPTIRDSQFTLPFPAGTMVNDQVKRDRYQLPGVPSLEGVPALLEAKAETAEPSGAESVSESIVLGWSFRKVFGLVLTFVVICLVAYSTYRLVSLKRRMT